MKSEDLNFKYHMGIHVANGAERVYKCEYKGFVLYCHIWTSKNKKTGKWGKGMAVYTIENERPEYKNIEEFLKVVEERTLKIVK